MPTDVELGESHRQFSAAWSLYAKSRSAGEVIDVDGLCIADSRHPWALLNAAMLTTPVSSQADLVARVDSAVEHFHNGGNPWFFAGGQTWLGEGAAQTLSRCGLVAMGSLVGMVTEQVNSPARPLPDVEARFIDDEVGRRGLADLNATVANVSQEWVRELATSDSFWKDPPFGYNAYIDDQPVATALVWPRDDVLYVGWVATSPDYRRRGLADLVTRRSLEHATRETGITRTVLHSTDDGYHVYLKMGYRPVEEFALCGLAEEPVASTLQPNRALQNVDSASDHQSGERQ